MTDPTTRKGWGVGRIAFMGRLAVIREQLGTGLPLTSIYEQHRDALGIGYQSFCKLVARYAEDAKPSVRRPYGTAKAVAPVPSSTKQDKHHARHDPRRAEPARRVFNHDGRTKEGEPEELFGPNFKPRGRG